VLLTDTVGFIQKLPTDLVAAFRATLEEVTEADAILQVLDLSSPALHEQAQSVELVLRDLGAADKPRVVALNKVDRLGPSTRRRLLQEMSALYSNVVAVSALGSQGLPELDQALSQAISEDMVQLNLLIPYGKESVLADLRQVGTIDRIDYREDGALVWGAIPGPAADRFRSYLAI
jgi:GTP-binding protein HflX